MILSKWFGPIIMLLNFCSKLGFDFRRMSIFCYLVCCGVVVVALFLHFQMPESYILRVPNGKSIVYPSQLCTWKKGETAGQKFWSARNWRRFRNFDLSLYHKKYIHGMYPPIMLLYVSTLWISLVLHLCFIHTMYIVWCPKPWNNFTLFFRYILHSRNLLVTGTCLPCYR